MTHYDQNTMPNRFDAAERFILSAHRYTYRSMWVQAIEDYESALRLMPTNALLYRDTAIAYIKINNIKEADAKFSRGFLLAVRQAKISEAQLILDEFTRHFPHSSSIQKFRNELQRLQSHAVEAEIWRLKWGEGFSKPE
ncbi:MAG: hypothetical protein SFU91_14250 [Chloroherpetonaceae bacterium]|nr:hypothetical protein [Chloroherpetonaceae bacterium]